MKMKTKILAQLCACLFTAGFSFGQDVHFSQMEFSPLNLNPALAGVNSTFQGIINYRSQWNSVASPYNTMAASVDGRFNPKTANRTGIIAGGLNFFNDISGLNKVSTTKINLSLAYHLNLDRMNTLGLGIYGGFGQRSLSLSDAQWNSQYDGTSYDASLAGEALDNNSFSWGDAGAGLVYSFKKYDRNSSQPNQRTVNAGVSFFHVNSPTYSFINTSNEKLYMRWSVFANGLIGLGNSNGAILPGIYFNKQGPSTEVLYGAYYRVALTESSQITGRVKPFYLHFGLFHRWGDALVAKTMLEWNTISAGFAYDINVSDLNTISRMRGGFELFLRYNLDWQGSSMSSFR